MTLQEFKDCARQSSPIIGLTDELTALWYDKNGDWETAHNVIKSLTSVTAAWVHAYLHRKEPDMVNAMYWYAKARRPIAKGPSEKEWNEIAGNLLAFIK